MMGSVMMPEAEIALFLRIDAALSNKLHGSCLLPAVGPCTDCPYGAESSTTGLFEEAQILCRV